MHVRGPCAGMAACLHGTGKLPADFPLKVRCCHPALYMGTVQSPALATPMGRTRSSLRAPGKMRKRIYVEQWEKRKKKGEGEGRGGREKAKGDGRGGRTRQCRPSSQTHWNDVPAQTMGLF